MIQYKLALDLVSGHSSQFSATQITFMTTCLLSSAGRFILPPRRSQRRRNSRLLCACEEFNKKCEKLKVWTFFDLCDVRISFYQQKMYIRITRVSLWPWLLLSNFFSLSWHRMLIPVISFFRVLPSFPLSLSQKLIPFVTYHVKFRFSFDKHKRLE